MRAVYLARYPNRFGCLQPSFYLVLDTILSNLIPTILYSPRICLSDNNCRPIDGYCQARGVSFLDTLHRLLVFSCGSVAVLALQCNRLSAMTPKELEGVIVKVAMLSQKELKAARVRANEAIGKLSNASKLPKKTRTGCSISTGSSFSTSAYDCRTGSKLRKVSGSVCSTCYACKGRQNFPQNQKAYRNRTALYLAQGPKLWAENLANAIESDSDFRFFDSGDITDYAMLRAIVTVAELRPDVRFWLPTKEYADVQRLRSEGVAIPSNLCVRLSVPMLDSDVPKYGVRSVVYRNASDVPKNAHICECSKGVRTECGDCRACWDSSVAVVCYLAH